MPASEPENPPISSSLKPCAGGPAASPSSGHRLVGLAAARLAAGLGVLLLIVGVALAVAYPNLPDIGSLTDYRPKLPLRVFSSDGVLLGEFGEERRNFTPIAQIPR
jgi:penicillin-binding protein 1A